MFAKLFFVAFVLSGSVNLGLATTNHSRPTSPALTELARPEQPAVLIQSVLSDATSKVSNGPLGASSSGSLTWPQIKTQVQSIPNNSTGQRISAPSARVVSPMNAFSGIGHNPNKINVPLYILKEAAYWSQLPYSRLRFDVSIPSGKTQWYSLFINLQSQDDPWSRTFRVFLNGQQRYSTVISPPGFSTTLDQHTMLWIGGVNTVELEIQWGTYSETGWKLLELYAINNEPSDSGLGNPDQNRLRDFAVEYFPKTDSVSPLTWQAKLGTGSKLDVNIQQGADPYSRCLRIYVDGVMRTGQCDYVVPGHFVISLGDYSQGLHWVKLEVKWGFYAEFGWKIDFNNFRLDYNAISVQADYMPGMAPSQDTLNYVQTYYSDHGPDRVTFYVTNQVTETRYLTANGYFSIYANGNPPTFNHINDPRWKYVIFGEYASDDGFHNNNVLGWSTGGGTPGQTSQYFFIAIQELRDCVQFGNICGEWPATEFQLEKDGDAARIWSYGRNDSQSGLVAV